MAIEVLIPPETDMLVPIERILTELGYDPESVDAAVKDPLIRMAQRATSTLERLVGRPLILQTVRERFSPTPRLRLPLRVWPVVEVLAVRTGDLELDTDAWSLEDAPSGMLIRLSDFGWGTGNVTELVPYSPGITMDPTAEARRRTWSVDYTGGYFVEDIGSGEPEEGQTALPLELEDLLIEVVRFFRARAQRDPTIRSESIGDWSGTYGLGAQDLGQSGLPLAIERRAMAWGCAL